MEVPGQAMRLLSLDGGGIRGLSSLYILQSLMEKIRFIDGLDNEPLPCDYFDMICGTSTGGIIALMLGRLKMPVSECIDAYLDMSRRVFGRRQNFTHRERFDPEPLEEAVKDIVERKTGNRDALLLDSTCCKTFVCTYESKALGGSPILLRTYQSGSAPIQCTIWEAARATSAAPTFFPPIRIRNHNGGEFIDAGVGYNNPAKIIVKEAKSYHRMKGYEVTRPTCLVSIGTGQKDLIQLDKAASVFWFKDRTGLSIAPVLGDIVTDCENTHDEVTLSCLEDNTADAYFRFNVSQGMQQIILDEWDKANDIRTYTDYYLRLNQTEHGLLKCVKLLRFEAQNIAEIEGSRERGSQRRSHSQALMISQGSNDFRGFNAVRGGMQFQGNFVDLQRGPYT